MSRPAAPPETTLTALAQLVETRSGLRFDSSRRAELVSKAGQAFLTSGYATWEAYLAGLSTPGSETALEQLLQKLTVGETYFFRHRPYFEALEREVLPEIIARRRATRRLRLWSAGCATGEEAYSLAILVRRLLPDVDQWQVAILATDLNRAYLDRAAAGLYGNWSFRETDDAFRAASFTREGDRYRVRPEVQRLVRFTPLNLAEDTYPSSVNGTTAFDLVLCRNVLLYFGHDLSRRVVGRLRDALVPDGWLVVGPSDPMPGLMAGFEMHAAPDAVLYRRRESDHPTPAVGLVPVGPAPDAAQTPLRGALPASVSTLRPSGRRVERQHDAVSRPPTKADNVETDWRELYRAARARADRGDVAGAEASCLQAIAQAGLQPEPYYLLGTLRQAQGDEQGALSAFRRALYADRAFVPAILALATLYRRDGRPDRAELALDGARRLLAGRAADEIVLADEGLTVGRLRDALAQASVDRAARHA